MELDSTIDELVRADQPVTLEALGGLEAIDTEHVTSPMFPYVVSALLPVWESLDPEGRDTARGLIAAAISETSSGLALSDICQVVVPAAVDLGIAVSVKASLRDRIRGREDPRSGALAAIALRWLAHLAVVTDTARGAVVDALSEVALEPGEPPPFATTAAQVAGIVYDHWRDAAATECLTRLSETSGDADAWFALGQARLVDALEAADHDSCLAGLESSLECFAYAANAEQRSDAVMYANAVRFITTWAAGASAEMLADYYQSAHMALHDYMLRGLGLPEQPVWLRPRYEAETAWIELIMGMERVTDRGTPDLRWYDAATAIGALAEVYRAANSFHPARTGAEAVVEGLADLVAPRLTAPFVERQERLGYVSRWLEDVDDPEAEAFADLVRERAEQVVPPKGLRSDGIRR